MSGTGVEGGRNTEGGGSPTVSPFRSSIRMKGPTRTAPSALLSDPTWVRSTDRAHALSRGHGIMFCLDVM